LPDGGVVRTFTDRTDYVQAQEALARQQAMLRALVNNIPDRIWLKDTHGVYLLSNPAHQRQHGLSEQEIIGRTAHELFGDAYGDGYRESDLLTMTSAEPLV
jgi:PAS domain S-box-containing protein